MAQKLIHRGVRFLVASEVNRGREWVIFPDDGAPDGAVSGRACAPLGSYDSGSFKLAISQARDAIDAWLDRADTITAATG